MSFLSHHRRPLCRRYLTTSPTAASIIRRCMRSKTAPTAATASTPTALQRVSQPRRLQSSNYWVDVVFNAKLGGYCSADCYFARTPTPNATGVARNTAVTAKFSEAVQQASVGFVLKNPANVTVPATLSYDSSTFTATLVPNAPLAASTRYSATVSGAKDALATP